jgi:hypothetical protein
VADAAGAAGDEQRLAAAQTERLERLVGREHGERQSRGLLERELGRHVGEEALWRRHVLGVGAVLEVMAAQVAVDLVTGPEPGDRRADLLDDAGRIPADDHREVVRQRLGHVAAADLRVDRIHAGRLDPHQHPVGRHGRRIVLDQLELVPATPLTYSDCAHEETVSGLRHGETTVLSTHRWSARRGSSSLARTQEMG